MKLNNFTKILFISLLSFFSLEAKESIYLDLQSQININLSQNLEKKFNNYNQKIENEKKSIIDTLSFLDLYKNRLINNNLKKRFTSILRNYKSHKESKLSKLLLQY